jgi:DNA invertase Pin-like site-specific DNA recombinase
MGVGMNKKKRAAIYLRVSTASQSTENQLRELRRVALRRGWQIVDVYEDRGVSGAKGREARPAFDRLHKDAARRKVDVVMSWSIDRLGRSLHHVVEFMAELGELGVGLYLHQQAVDSSTPAGKAMLSMCGVFAEFERAIIVERVRAGLARARAQGTRLGRPRVDEETEIAIRQKRSEGCGILKIARELGVGVSVVQRIVADPGQRRQPRNQTQSDVRTA